MILEQFVKNFLQAESQFDFGVRFDVPMGGRCVPACEMPVKC